MPSPLCVDDRYDCPHGWLYGFRPGGLTHTTRRDRGSCIHGRNTDANTHTNGNRDTDANTHTNGNRDTDTNRN
jgi:hypothetical protein